MIGNCVFLPLSSYVDIPRMTRTEVFGWTHRPNEMAVVPWSDRATQVTRDITEEAQCVEIVDLVIRDAFDWVASGLLVDGASRHACPGSGAEALTTRLRRDVEAREPILVSRHSQVGLTGVVYAGRRPSAKFYGCALGRVVDPEDPPASLLSTLSTRNGDEVPIPVDSEGWRGRRGAGAKMTHRIDGAPILVQSLVLQDPHDWAINDLRIDGRSLLLYPGDLPGEALQMSGRPGAHLGVACREVEILVSYYGDREIGSELRCTIVGRALDN
jgi:hypothetical protein